MLRHLIIAIVSSLIVGYLFRLAQGKARREAGVSELYPGGPLKALVLGCTLFAAFVAYAATQASADQRILAAVVATCLVLGVIYLNLSVFPYRVRWDLSGVWAVYFGRNGEKIPWNEIQDFQYNTGSQVFSVYGRSGKKITFPNLFRGVDDFIETLQKNSTTLLAEVGKKTLDRNLSLADRCHYASALCGFDQPSAEETLLKVLCDHSETKELVEVASQAYFIMCQRKVKMPADPCPFHPVARETLNRLLNEALSQKKAS